MDLRVFLKESPPISLTSMATLRGRASILHPNDSTLTQEIETAVMQARQSNSEPVPVSHIF